MKKYFIMVKFLKPLNLRIWKFVDILFCGEQEVTQMNRPADFSAKVYRVRQKKVAP